MKPRLISRSLSAAMAAAMVATAIALATPSTAYAVLGDGGCDTGEFCMWRDANYYTPAGIKDRTSTLCNFVGYQYDNYGVSLNDSVSSSRNRNGTYYWRLWEHHNAAGVYLTHLKSGQVTGGLSYQYPYVFDWMNDKASCAERRTST